MLGDYKFLALAYNEELDYRLRCERNSSVYLPIDLSQLGLSEAADLPDACHGRIELVLLQTFSPSSGYPKLERLLLPQVLRYIWNIFLIGNVIHMELSLDLE